MYFSLIHVFDIVEMVKFEEEYNFLLTLLTYMFKNGPLPMKNDTNSLPRSFMNPFLSKPTEYSTWILASCQLWKI